MTKPVDPFAGFLEAIAAYYAAKTARDRARREFADLEEKVTKWAGGNAAPIQIFSTMFALDDRLKSALLDQKRGPMEQAEERLRNAAEALAEFTGGNIVAKHAFVQEAMR